VSQTFLDASNKKIISPEVSIITPAYNAGLYFDTCIQSVLDQDFLNWELLLAIDFKSTDNTLSIAQNYAKKDSRITVFHSAELNHVTKNRNYCMAQSRGRYLAFLDADDLWYPQKLSRQLDFMTSITHEFSST
jgi:teichuronic acid biosynthesis glycosyltransferase TuaG